MQTQNLAEQAVLKDIEAQLAAGGDPFGDDEPIVAPTIESQAVEAAAELAAENGEPAADAPGDKPADDKPAAAEATDTPADEPAATVPESLEFKTAGRTALDKDRADLLTQKADAFKKVMDGEMEPAAYAQLETEIASKLDTLLVQRTLLEANEQTRAKSEEGAIAAIMESSKKAGQIDYYADKAAQRQFDIAMSGLSEDPANAKLSFADLTQKAHGVVLALRGVAPAAKVPPTDKPPARAAEKGPMTLRGLPSAEVANTGNTLADAMGKLKGAAYQAAYAKLTPTQKAALVDE